MCLLQSDLGLVTSQEVREVLSCEEAQEVEHLLNLDDALQKESGDIFGDIERGETGGCLPKQVIYNLWWRCDCGPR